MARPYLSTRYHSNLLNLIRNNKCVRKVKQGVGVRIDLDACEKLHASSNIGYYSMERLFTVSPIRQLILSFLVQRSSANSILDRHPDVVIASVCIGIRRSLCNPEAYQDRCASILCARPSLCGIGPVGTSESCGQRSAEWLARRLRSSFAQLRAVLALFGNQDVRGCHSFGGPRSIVVHFVPVRNMSVALVRDTRNVRGKAVGSAAAAE